ncbi:MAG: NADPH-dependent F420 reductase [Actinomycetota bacterium]|jgi:NADPH-dependent F420 reductase|nr:NADPH-dependent F420 reductase [Actinomycetota bacterium]
MRVGIIGGTGPAGRGLAARLAVAGVEVLLGSRDAQRAQSVAGDLNRSWAGRLAVGIAGTSNDAAAGADQVIVATPWDATIGTIGPLAEPLAGKVVVSMVNALVREGREMLAVVPARGSMAGAVQGILRRSLVAAAFHHLPASEMEDPEARLAADVLVCSDHDEAGAATMALVDRVEGLRAVDAGSLSQATAIEAFTAVLVNVNIRNRAHSSIRLSGI